MTEEEWRIVPSVPKIMACSDGRIMTVPTRKPMPHGGKRSYGGRPYFGVWNKTDARFITVVEGKTHKVARLVAEAFHGPPPFDGAVVMHLDENAPNNRASNLAWGTQRENLNAPAHSEWRQGGRNGDVSELIARRA